MDLLNLPDNALEGLRDQLKYTPLFVRLNDAELEMILRVGRKEDYSPGEVIVNEGSPGDALFIILEGSSDVVKKGKAQTVKLSTLRKESCFGEMSLLDIEPRSCSVIAVEKTTVLRFGVEDLAQVFNENLNILPLVVTNIARILSRRLRVADEKLVEKKGG